MLCEHCKMREATVKYVEVINGVKTEHNLCAACAGRVDIGQYSALFEGEFPLGKLLSGLLGIQNMDQSTVRLPNVACPACGTTYEDFVTESKFGCPDCYSVFDPLIGENIRHLQGSERHVGKRPNHVSNGGPDEKELKEKAEGLQSTLTGEEKVRLLKARLKDALRREDYEEAASLRDEIHKYKEERKQDGEVV